MDVHHFEQYTLSNETVEKLKGINDELKENADDSNSTWRMLFHVEVSL